MKKFALAATALALVATTITAAPASAAAVSAKDATVGASCAVEKQVAPKRGADGSDLVCRKATIGTSKGIKQWLYAEDPILSSLDMLVTAGVGGGFDTFGVEVNKALKAEGLVEAEPTKRNISGGGQTIGLSSFYNNDSNQPNKAVVIGWASIGGWHVNKGAVRVSQLVPAVSLMRDPIAIAVPADSKYKTMADLLKDMKAKKIAIAGGSLGTADHFFIAKIYEAIKKPNNINYVAYSGGGGVVGAILSDATFAAAVSGYDEFAPQVEAGKLRVLAISFDKRIPGVNVKTLKEQGVNVVVGNWRGIALPAGTSVENRNKFIRAISVMRSSIAWQRVLSERNWSDYWQRGNQFNNFVVNQEKQVSESFKKLGL